jgi:hypothetical protein
MRAFLRPLILLNCLATLAVASPVQAEEPSEPPAPAASPAPRTRIWGSGTLEAGASVAVSSGSGGSSVGVLPQFRFRLEGIEVSPGGITSEAAILGGVPIRPITVSGSPGDQTSGNIFGLRFLLGYTTNPSGCGFQMSGGIDGRISIAFANGEDKPGARPVGPGPLMTSPIEIFRLEPGMACVGEKSLFRIAPVASAGMDIGTGTAATYVQTGAIAQYFLTDRVIAGVQGGYRLIPGGDHSPVAEFAGNLNVRVGDGIFWGKELRVGADARVSERLRPGRLADAAGADRTLQVGVSAGVGF